MPRALSVVPDFDPIGDPCPRTSGRLSQRQLLDAYLAIPEHLRHYALGDMDNKDWPLQTLAVGVGGLMPRTKRAVTEEMHTTTLTYFIERNEHRAAYQAKTEAFGPLQPQAPTISLAHRFFPKGWPDDPGLLALRNEYPCPIQVRGTDYPHVDRAYLAFSTDDANQHQAILTAESEGAAKHVAEMAPRRQGWDQARPAVMAQLMRAKYAQHPTLAQLLLSTGDAKILYSSADSYYWGEAG